MTDDKNKDIVEEVFGKPTKSDEKVSALFMHLKEPEHTTPQPSQKTTPDFTQSPKSSPPKTTSIKSIDNTKSNRRLKAIVTVGFAILVPALLTGGYFAQHGKASTKIIAQTQTIAPTPPQPLPKTQPEPVPQQIENNLPTLNWPQVINWHRLLDDISTTMPKTVQLNVFESKDASDMLIAGKALSLIAIRDFVDALTTNTQIESAQLTDTSTTTLNSEDLFIFSINCNLASQTETQDTLDSDQSNSDLDTHRLFTTTQADEFLISIQTASEQTGCMVKSFLISPDDTTFNDEKTNTNVNRKHATLTFLGGYKNILNTIENLQNHPQTVWLDSITIAQADQTSQLQCTTKIAIYTNP